MPGAAMQAKRAERRVTKTTCSEPASLPTPHPPFISIRVTVSCRDAGKGQGKWAHRARALHGTQQLLALKRQHCKMLSLPDSPAEPPTHGLGLAHAVAAPDGLALERGVERGLAQDQVRARRQRDARAARTVSDQEHLGWLRLGRREVNTQLSGGSRAR